MSVEKSALKIPVGFRHWQGDPAEDHIGPFFYKMVGGNNAQHVQTAFLPKMHHCNTYGGVHGGVLMTFADYALCLAAIESEADSVVTVSATCEFIDGAREGEWLSGTGELTRMTGSMAFTRVVIRAGERVVMTASGVIKRLRKP